MRTALLICLSAAAVMIARADSLFTPPEAPFVTALNEELYRVVLPAGPVESAQALIDEARSARPGAQLILEAGGPLVVRANPLRLGSRMSLHLSPAAGITADRAASAASLIAIGPADHVSVSSSGPGPAQLDGGKKAIVGIKVDEGIRINLDQLQIVGCANAGITLGGRDPTKVTEACSVTRCFFAGNGDGLRVERSAAFMCLENEFKNQSGTALTIKSLCSVVAGNSFKANKAAIQSGSDRGVITRNIIEDAQALTLTSESSGILVSENRSAIFGLKIALDGKNHQFFHNTLDGSASLAPNCGEMLLLANKGLRPVAAAANLKFFNPPTLGYPHKDPLIVPGLERFDLTVPGGKEKVTEIINAASGKKTVTKEKAVPVDLAQVQQAVNQAETTHPHAVLVLHLEGEYLSRALKGLELPPNTCVILQGRILADYGTRIEPQYLKEAPLSQVVLMPAGGFGSFSGGTLDGGRQAFFPINAATKSIALIEEVNLTAGARDGFYCKGRDAQAPVFIYRCVVSENLGRGIWSHVASRVHSIGNTITGNRSDGIDLDALSKDGTALFNVSCGNRRHGVFIEEGIHHHIVFGNTLSGNTGAGVHVWNEEIKGNTGSNVIAANRCDANGGGITVGGRSSDKTANENFMFNNVCRQNRTDGFRTGNSKAQGNYFSQCVAGENNEKDINAPASAQAGIFNDVIQILSR